MSRMYAGILGFLAACVTILRGVKESAGSNGTFGTAIVSLLLFALVGAIVGAIAESTISESVRQEMENELNRKQE